MISPDVVQQELNRKRIKQAGDKLEEFFHAIRFYKLLKINY
jgi:hypothetical protein